MKHWRYFLPLGIFLALSIALLVLLGQQQTLITIAKEDHPRPLPEFSLPNVKGDAPFMRKEIRGYAVINIAASWCTACKIEQPALAKLANQVSVYGVMWKDKPQVARMWLKREGNPFKKVGLDEDGRFAVDIGLTGVPETLLIDPNGMIISHIRGPVTEENMQTEILDKMK